MRRRDALRAGGALLGVGTRPAGADRATGTAGEVGSNADGSYGPLARLDVRGTKEAVVSPDGTTAYLAVTDGYATVDLSDPADPTVLAERRSLLADREDGPMAEVYDAKLAGDTLAVVGPANDPDAGPNGALLVDVSDPTDPVRRGFHPTEFPIHNCSLDGDHLYLTAYNGAGNPLVVVDVAADPPREVARWSLPAHDDAWRDVPAFLRPLHEVWVRDGFAALSYWDAGTYLLDVSEPSDPAFLGRIPALPPDELADALAPELLSPPGNHHSAATDPANDLLAVGKESWDGPSGITLYDVSDPADPVELSTIDPPAAADPARTGTWTTAHNFEVRDGTLYSSWYQGGVKRHDVSDPTNPAEETWWADPAAARFWTARVAGDGPFVASTMGTRADSTPGGTGAPAGLWTFPDEAGVGGDRDALTAPPDSTPTAKNATTAATNGAATAAGTPDPTPTTGTGTDATASAGPGFGPLAAVGGVGLAVWRALRADREKS